MVEKQKRFCDAYLANGCDANQAAIEAGYSKVTAKYAYKWLGPKKAYPDKYKPELDAYIKSQSQNVHDSKIADAQELFEFWSAVMRGDEKETVVASSGKVVEVPASMQNRIKASELRAKALNLFTSNINVTGSLPIVIKDDVNE